MKTVVLLLLSILFSTLVSSSPWTKTPPGCVRLTCRDKNAPSACSAGFQHYDEQWCGALWLKRKEICCPIEKTTSTSTVGSTEIV